MDTLSFLSYRVGFLELPPAELRAALEKVLAGSGWGEIFERMALDLGRLARNAARHGRAVSAAQAWIWTASACQAASLALHFTPGSRRAAHRAIQLRSLAAAAYRRALALDPRLGSSVAIRTAAGDVHGYLRIPAQTPAPAPVVVLVNGLDSVCEAELHAFGHWLLARGLAVLSLDLPAGFGRRPRTPHHRVEELAPPIADWLGRQASLGVWFGAFGVSFGGYLVARLLAGEPRFVAGVAVSPPAWLDDSHLRLQRFRAMLRLAFDLLSDEEVDELAPVIGLDDLPAPAGRLLIYQMRQDELFGPEHGEALCIWCNGAARLCVVSGEHVGTSQVHRWLPEACDWLDQQLSPARRQN